MRYPKGKSIYILLLCCSICLGQYQIPAKPKKSEQTSVYDYINLLSTLQQRSLEQKLVQYSDSTSTQIVIAIIASTGGENINFLGAQWGQQWGIGQDRKDNGILVLLAKEDRRVAINTGYGIESTLTDALSRKIIETVIIPQFKIGDYYGGLDRGTDAVFDVLNGQFKEDRNFGNNLGLGSLLPFIIFLIILIIIWSRKDKGNRNNRGGRFSGPDIWDVIILSNMGRGGSSSGGGFGSGGFGGGFGGGGFGGGGFGGGGASGGW